MFSSYSPINGRRAFNNDLRWCRMSPSFHSFIILRNNKGVRMILRFNSIARITYHQNIKVALVVSKSTSFVVCFIPNDIFSTCITPIEDNHTYIHKVLQYQFLQHCQLFLCAFGQTLY